MTNPVFWAVTTLCLLLTAHFVASAPAPGPEDKTVMRTSHYTAKNKVARDELVKGFNAIAEYSFEHESKQVLRYVVTVPWDATDETSIYTIEHYSSQSALKAHDHAAPVHYTQHLIGPPAMPNSHPPPPLPDLNPHPSNPYLTSPPEIYTWHPTGIYQRPDILALTANSTSKILIVYGTVDYTPLPPHSPSSPPPSNSPTSLETSPSYFPTTIFPAFLHLCETLMTNEPGTYGTTFLADFKNQTQALRVLEIFESLEHYNGNHHKNQDIIEFFEKYPPRGKDLAEVRIVGGFLGRV